MKPLVWIGSSLDDMRAFPDEVKQVMGYGLYLAQMGGKHPDAKPLKSFGGSVVLELIDDFKGDTYRAVYTVKFHDLVYVLHAFQKKAKHGIATPKQEIELVKARLRRAQEHYERQRGQKG